MGESVAVAEATGEVDIEEKGIAISGATFSFAGFEGQVEICTCSFVSDGNFAEHRRHANALSLL